MPLEVSQKQIQREDRKNHNIIQAFNYFLNIIMKTKNIVSILFNLKYLAF